eukprot:7536550-Prorocentrum_lima.AAC.1
MDHRSRYKNHTCDNGQQPPENKTRMHNTPTDNHTTRTNKNASCDYYDNESSNGHINNIC